MRSALVALLPAAAGVPFCTTPTLGRAPTVVCVAVGEDPLSTFEVSLRALGRSYVLATSTRPGDCNATESPSVSGGGGSSVTTQETLACSGGRVVVTTTYSAAGVADGLAAVQADVSVASNNSEFGPPDITTTWDLPPQSNRVWVGGAADEPFDASGGWLSPFALTAPLHLRYGGNGNQDPVKPHATLSLPVVTWIEQQDGVGVTIALSPADRTPAMSLFMEPSAVPAASGSVHFQRHNMRVPKGELRLQQFIVAHEADWRPGVGWYSASFPSWFEIGSVEIGDDSGLWGAASYSDFRGQQADAERFKALNFGFNWDASFPFPFWGQWLGLNTTSDFCVAIGHEDDASGVYHPQRHGTPPPGVPAGPGVGECERISYQQVAGWYSSGRKLGFSTLAYANLMEWGYSLPPGRAENVTQCADPHNATAYCAVRRLWKDFSGGYISDCEYSFPSDWNGSTFLDGWPIAPGIKLVDPAHPARQRDILRQVRLQITQTPSHGLCVDRSDHTDMVYRTDADDGVSWKDGPAKWMGFSYQETSALMADELHNAGQVLFVSSTNARIDLLRSYDGIYDEFGDSPRKMVLDGLLSLYKPAAGWQHHAAAGRRASKNLPGCRAAPVTPLRRQQKVWDDTAWDTALQQHLVSGVQPTIALQWGDHLVVPSECGDTPDACDKYYLPYMDMFRLLRRKRWLLKPHPVTVNATGLSTNVFVVARGVLVIAAACGAPGVGAAVHLTVPRSVLPFPAANATALWPGQQSQRQQLPAAPADLSFDLPLQRGMVAVLLQS